MAKEEEKKDKKVRAKDVQRGVWNPETLSEIKYKAETGKHRIRGCGATIRFPSFDDLLILPSQLSRLSIDTYREDCKTQTILGTRFAKKPLVIETPIMISGMSYGALSKEAKTALAKSTQIVGTSINNGEGGLLPEERDNSYKQVIQITPSRMGFSLKNIEAADAIEIICGIGAKPGLSGHLMGSKITKEIAAFRQLPEGIDLHSHPRHGDIFGADDMVLKIQELRDVTDWQIPIFVTLPALVQAVRALEEMGVKQEISLIVSGGIKDGSDVAKALALGADAVALGTGAMVAMGCAVCLRCHEGKCAFGIGTQDPERRKRLDIDAAAQRVANYIVGMTCEATLLAKAAGKTALANMEREDLRAMTLEACAMTGIPLVGSNYTFGEAFGFF